MFSELLAYDPETIDASISQDMARILQAHAEILCASAEVSSLRARVWAGESGVADYVDLKAQGLAKLREDYSQQLIAFTKDSVDVDGLLDLLPVLLVAVLNKFKVPPMLLLEAFGIDIDNIKKIAESLKGLIDGE